MDLNEEQKNALEAMMSGRNVFLTGAAGTGKSTVLRSFIANCNRNCAVLAPTGLAAVNVNGSTINSFFLLPMGLIHEGNIGPLTSRRRIEALRAVKTIVIDEISMVRSDIFAAMDLRLRAVAAPSNGDKPFGGKQMIVIGDFFQLAPVVKSDIEGMFLKANFGGEYAFQTDLWKHARFASFSLGTIYRQKDDGLFISALNCIRDGNIATPAVDCGEGDIRSGAEIINDGSCIAEGREFRENAVNLCTTNREATAINAAAMAKLPGPKTTFRAAITGEFPASSFPTDELLELVPGARVMLLCNKRLSDGVFQYVNGDIGVISAINAEGVPSVRIALDKGGEVTVEGHCWDNCRYVAEKDPETGVTSLRKESIGQFVQLPLRLAWAITIHKSQGMSFDAVNLRLGNGCFSHGQLYTALSRCRTLDGLRIDRPIMDEDAIVDQEVLDFCKQFAPRMFPAGEVSIKVPASMEAQIRALIAQHLAAQRISA